MRDGTPSKDSEILIRIPSVSTQDPRWVVHNVTLRPLPGRFRLQTPLLILAPSQRKEQFLKHVDLLPLPGSERYQRFDMN